MTQKWPVYSRDWSLLQLWRIAAEFLQTKTMILFPPGFQKWPKNNLKWPKGLSELQGAEAPCFRASLHLSIWKGIVLNRCGNVSKELKSPPGIEMSREKSTFLQRSTTGARCNLTISFQKYQDYVVSFFSTFAAFNVPSTDPPNDLMKFDLELEISIFWSSIRA